MIPTTTMSSSSSSSTTTTTKSTTATTATTTTTTTTTTSSTKPLPVFEKLLPKTAAPRGSTATENVPEASQPIADKLVLADSPEKLMSVPAETSKEDQQRSFTSYIEKICPVLTVFALPIILIIEIINAYSYICLLKNNNKPKIITACCNNCDSAEKKGPTEV